MTTAVVLPAQKPSASLPRGDRYATHLDKLYDSIKALADMALGRDNLLLRIERDTDLTEITGTPGATGPTGPAGADGDDGADGVTVFLAASHQTATATGAGDVNLFTLAIPGGTLSTNKGLRCVFHCRRTTGSGQVTCKPKYGGTNLHGGGSLTGPNFRVEVYLWAAGATNAQRSAATIFAGGSTSSHATVAAAIDSTASQNLTFDVDLATDSDVVTLDWVSVEVLEIS